jgi:acetyl esterase/lipase
VVSLRDLTNKAKRAHRELHGLHPDVSEHDIEIPIRDGSAIPARVYYPAELATTNRSLPILVFFHGGGFCIGNRCDDFESNRAIAVKNKAVIVSPEYRLAPEHPFPTAVFDGLDTIKWVRAIVLLSVLYLHQLCLFAKRRDTVSVLDMK